MDIREEKENTMVKNIGNALVGVVKGNLKQGR